MEHKGFLASLFDTSFSSLVTTKVIKLIYILSMLVIGLLALAFVVGAFRASAGFGLLTLLVLAPVGSLIYLTYTRMFLEFVIALFRIMENTHELVRLGRIEHGETPNAVAPRVDPPAAAAFAPPAAPTSEASALPAPRQRRFDPQTGEPLPASTPPPTT